MSCRRLAFLVLLLAFPASAHADCIGKAGESFDDQSEEHHINSKSSDVKRFVRLTTGRATIDVKVIDQGNRQSSCQGSARGLEFDIAWTKTGAATRCKTDDEEGPALALHCRMTAFRPGRYFVRIRNNTCGDVVYMLRCRNRHIAPP